MKNKQIKNAFSKKNYEKEVEIIKVDKTTKDHKKQEEYRSVGKNDQKTETKQGSKEKNALIDIPELTEEDLKEIGQEYDPNKWPSKRAWKRAKRAKLAGEEVKNKRTSDRIPQPKYFGVTLSYLQDSFELLINNPEINNDTYLQKIVTEIGYLITDEQEPEYTFVSLVDLLERIYPLEKRPDLKPIAILLRKADALTNKQTNDRI